MKTEPNNCISCEFQTLLQFVGVIGFPAISLQCIHRNKVEKISISKFHCVIATLILTGLLLVVIYLSLTIHQANADGISPLKWMTTLTVLLLSCRYLQIVANGLWNTKIALFGYRASDLMYKNWTLVTGETLLTAENVKLFNRKSVLVVGIALAAPTASIIYVLNLKFEQNSAYFEQLVCSFVFYIELLFSFGCILQYDAVTTCIKLYHDNLKKFMSEYLTSNSPEKKTFESYVSLAARQHLSFMYVFRYIEKFSNPNSVLWLTSSTLILIVNSFVIFSALFDYENAPAGLLVIELQLLASLYFMWKIVDNIQHFDTLNDEILSFLFKYPVSKLTRTEALQVETLIIGFISQRPVFNACDIFVVGRKLFATVVGTIVTYVMVALQFHKTWTNAYS